MEKESQSFQMLTPFHRCVPYGTYLCVHSHFRFKTDLSFILPHMHIHACTHTHVRGREQAGPSMTANCQLQLQGIVVKGWALCACVWVRVCAGVQGSM